MSLVRQYLSVVYGYGPAHDGDERKAALLSQNEANFGHHQVSDALAELFYEAMQRGGLTWSAIAERVSADERTVKRWLGKASPKTSLKAENIASLAEVLSVPPADVLRAIFPDLEDDQTLLTRLREVQERVGTLTVELSRARSETDVSDANLSLIDQILSSGRWSVGLLPHSSGPTPDTEVLAAIRVAVAPARADILPAGTTAREELLREIGDRIEDRAVLTSHAVKPRASPPVAADPSQVVHLSVPVFTQDRPVSRYPIPLPKLHSSTILVLALTQSAWRANVAAIVGRALGWGVKNVSNDGRVHSLPRDIDRDVRYEALNVLRNEGLHRFLCEPPRRTVIHHVGHPPVGEILQRHALVEMIDSEFREDLPFVVLLSESDRVLKRQVHKSKRFDSKEPRFSRQEWTEWRNELRDSVESLSVRKHMIIQFDFPWERLDNVDSPPEDDVEFNRSMWFRSAKLANDVLNTVFSLGTVGQANRQLVDEGASRMIEAVRHRR